MTRDRILDAAEQAFATQGFSGASLRSITAEAGVNLAAVNYHFQSKEALFDAVIARRMQYLNKVRLDRLDEVLAKDPTLEEVLDAFIRPVLEFVHQPGPGQFAVQLIARIYAEPGAFERNFQTHLRELAARFSAAIAQTCPGIPQDALIIRLHATVGGLINAVTHMDLLKALSNGAIDLTTDAYTRQLVTFFAAGFRAASAQEHSTL